MDDGAWLQDVTHYLKHRDDPLPSVTGLSGNIHSDEHITWKWKMVPWKTTLLYEPCFFPLPCDVFVGVYPLGEALDPLYDSLPTAGCSDGSAPLPPQIDEKHLTDRAGNDRPASWS